MISVKSEIMPLKRVLLHRPGNELLNLTPDSLNRLLFEDIPYLKGAREEHDELARILNMNGVEVLYLEDLMTEILNNNFELRDKFVRQFVYEAGIKTQKYKDIVIKFLLGFTDNRELVLKTMEGININELYTMERDMEHSLVDLVTEESKFLAEPMPNLVYMRDLASIICNGVSLNRMHSDVRSRESIYIEYIFNYHPDYKEMVKYYDRYGLYHIEGGDILVLNEHVLVIGVSQRTSPEAIEKLASNMFKDKDCSIDTILSFVIPDSRACMHLDTVFTQVDYDKFVYYPGIMNTLSVFEIKEDVLEGIKVKEINNDLEHILEKYLDRDITLIPCGGGDKIIAEREQWNDGVNMLCVSPGIVVAYDRNNITNAVLRRYGIKVIEIHSSELSRGRGGPRCMSMPLIREER